VHTARERVILALPILAMILTVASCSRSGGAGPPSGEAPSTAAQATPAASPEAASQSAEPAESAIPEAPELKPENAAGAVKGIPAATNTVPIVAVANYFTELPGIDVAGLKRGQKEKFLQRVNSEICSCGCKNDTLARCYVNDPRCPAVKTLVQKVYDEVKGGK
jgi:hypothetical protein